MVNFTKYYTDTPMYTHEPGLVVMKRLCTRLGSPQDSLRCIHIAGTNGKGSCAAMLASVLQAAGYRTGLFTSPDLNGLAERIRLDGVPIPDDDFAAVTAAVRAAAAEDEEPSYFEKLTMAAFLYYSRMNCDYVVLETGLGGRLDATNIILSPAASVIMPIGLDHIGILGDTIPAIAREKCGIIKPGCPVISAPQTAAADEVIRAACDDAGAPLTTIDITQLQRHGGDVTGQDFSYRDLEYLHIRLLGPHQTENACTAAMTARVLGLSDDSIRRGLTAAAWPGRLEYFPGDPPLFIDGAHNAHGVTALAAALRDLMPDTRFTLMMGVMADKDWREMVRLMTPLAAEVICLAPDSPRALPPDELAAAFSGIPVRCADSPAEALAMARTYGRPICAFGSLYYIGALRALLCPADR